LPVSLDAIASSGRGVFIDPIERRPILGEKIDGCWSAPGLALRFGTSETWLRGKIAEGAMPARRHPTTRRWLIPDDPTVLARLEKLAAARRRLGGRPIKEALS
jgi:hypothetical protein